MRPDKTKTKNSRLAGKKASKGAASPAGRELAEIFCSMLEDLPGVTTTQHMGHTSFLTGKNVFAFTRTEGVALKLPRDKAQALVLTGDAEFLAMGKRTMKEWVVIQHDGLETYRKNRNLLIEAKTFVASLAKTSGR